VSSTSELSEPVWVEPDLEFIRTIARNGGDSFKKCIQCGTCSGTCTISPDSFSFPCKEMAWAAWGMKDRLLKDVDIWLCFQCNDCSVRCPRGAKPGYILGAIRQECVEHYSVPRFLGRMTNQPQSILLMLGIPTLLLTIALVLKSPIESALGITKVVGERIIYNYSSIFPHWLLNSFFGLILLLIIITAVAGAMRYWRAIKNEAVESGDYTPIKGVFPSFVATVKTIFAHDRFSTCEKSRSRFWSHMFVFFGFMALCVVTIWVITASINPLIRDGFVYPFSFWSPWKILANIGGLAVFAGCVLMIRDRVKDRRRDGLGSYFDWSFIAVLLGVVLTGFITEALHYVRLEPHRHIAYFLHLVLVLTLLMYFAYSKFAHILYRTVALVFAEHTGREDESQQVRNVTSSEEAEKHVEPVTE
jgi:quinone-modifying oxidoreductase subunit QmoC